MSVVCQATTRAHANIALAKYWGKSDVELNLPAVPSLSLTLDALKTETTLSFESDLAHDEVLINAQPASLAEHTRISRFLDRLRARFEVKHFARVRTHNHFPTAAGLASSASGFAALVSAFNAAWALGLSASAQSALARRGSASAARSIFAGFAKLEAGLVGDDTLCAEPIVLKQPFDLRVVIAITALGPKSMGSTEAMTHSKNTAFYYQSWVEGAPRIYQRIYDALMRADLEALGAGIEASTMSMHACMLSSDPAIVYWNSATLSVLERVRKARAQLGLKAYVTMDAGPQVKVFCMGDDVERVQALLAECPGVERTLVSAAGPGVEVLESAC